MSIAAGPAEESAFTANPSSCVTQSPRASCAPFPRQLPAEEGTVSTGKGGTLLEQRGLATKYRLTAGNPRQRERTATRLG